MISKLSQEKAPHCEVFWLNYAILQGKLGRPRPPKKHIENHH